MAPYIQGIKIDDPVGHALTSRPRLLSSTLNNVISEYIGFGMNLDIPVYKACVKRQDGTNMDHMELGYRDYKNAVNE
jgi:hypothetical protein